MNKKRIFLISVVLICLFLLVYSPHFNYKFPLHADEWHAITEATKLGNREYNFIGKDGIRTMGFEIGFHVFLFVISGITNLVFFYKFLPAIWAVLTALILFYVVYKKTNNFFIGLFSMIFFASLKSNVNILGLWFFTPLTFALPFIFLYVFFFTEGLEKQNKKFILLSLGIMLFLLFAHAVSVLFAIPFLLIYSLFYLNYIKKEFKFFLWFLLIPVVGILFYSLMTHVSIIGASLGILNDLQFKTGWTPLEVKNSFLEMYSLIGYFLALLGIAGLFLFQKNIKKYLAYILWPLVLFVMIFIFRITGVSYISPYQRNLYYFALSLPFLSSIGLYHVLRILKSKLKNFNFDEKLKSVLIKILSLIVIFIVLFFTFNSYYKIPSSLGLYYLVDEQDYNSFLFLSKQEKGIVLGLPGVSTGIYPISGHEPVATLFFYGNRKDSELFFNTQDCNEKQEIIDKYDVSYVLSPQEIDCDWNLIYGDEGYIYSV